MKTKWYASLVTLVALTLVLGCENTTTATPDQPTDQPAAGAAGTDAVAQLSLCGKCGQVKGSAACCAQGAVTCAKCGLVKGSPGCCAITKGTDAVLCAKCGQVKGSDACCAADAVKCAKCGLVKGSPGCCAAPKKQDQSPATESPATESPTD